RAPRQFAVDPLSLRPRGEAGAARGADAGQAARDAGDADGVRAALGRRRGGDAMNGAPEGPAAAAFDRRMLEFLVCPVTRGPLVYDAGRQELVSKGAGLAFPI